MGEASAYLIDLPD